MKNDRTASAQEVLEFLTAVMRGEQRENTLRFAGSGIQSIDDIRPPVHVRVKAAEILGKRYRLFTERVEVEDVSTAQEASEKFDEYIKALSIAEVEDTPL